MENLNQSTDCAARSDGRKKNNKGCEHTYNNKKKQDPFWPSEFFFCQNSCPMGMIAICQIFCCCCLKAQKKLMSTFCIIHQ